VIRHEQQHADVEIHDDESAARERFALVAGGIDALLALRVGIRWFQALNRRELTAARDCLADDLVVIDHRPASPFPSKMLRADAYFAQIESLMELSPDVRWWSAEGGVAHGRVSVSSIVISGHWGEGGGSAEIPLAVVTSVRDGRFDRFEFIPADAHAEQRARLAELAAERQP
jgi:ketosteroid isomerase-like protein